MPVRDLTAEGNAAKANGSAWNDAIAEGMDFGNTIAAEALPDGSDVSQSIDDGSSAGASDLTGGPAGVQAPETPQTPVGDQGTAAPATPAVPVAATPSDQQAAPVAEPEPEVDPLKDAVPFTFTVDGRDETIADALVIPGDGLYVPEAAIPHFKLMASQAKTLDRQVNALREESKQKDGLWERLTTHTFKNDKNEDVTLKGLQGLEALRLESVSDKAALSTLVQALTNPQRFSQLIDYVKVDGAGNKLPADAPEGTYQWMPVLNQGTWRDLARESSLNVKERRLAITDQMRQWAAPPPPPEPTADQFAGGTIDALATQYDLKALTPQDKQFLASHFPTYTREATPQERQQYGVPRMVLPAFVELMKDRNELRAEAAQRAKDAAEQGRKAGSTESKAKTFNAGMQNGRKPAVAAQRPAATSTNQPAPSGRFAPPERKKSSANDNWSALIDSALEGIG